MREEMKQREEGNLNEIRISGLGGGNLSEIRKVRR